MSELVWKEIRNLQKQVEFLNKHRKAQERTNAELWECINQTTKQVNFMSEDELEQREK